MLAVIDDKPVFIYWKSRADVNRLESAKEVYMAQHIYLIRHCQAEGQAPEAPLTDKGKADAEKLADALKDKAIEAIYSSPFVRAVQTATPLAKRLGLPIRTDDRLAERILSSQDLPDWLDRLKATYTDLDLKFEGGESSREAIERAFEALNHLLETGVRSAAIVTHGNLMSLILYHLDRAYGFAAWAAFTNPDVYLLTYENGHFEIKTRLWT